MSTRSIPADTKLSYGSVRNSNSTAFSSSASMTCIDRRPIGRADIKDHKPDADDLYDLGGKYPTKEDLQAILEEATQGLDPIPLKRAQFRSGPHSFKKDELLARCLVYPRTRQALLDLLIDKGKVSETATLEDFYLKFCEDGPIFPGDAPETKELQLAAGIEYIESKNTEEKKKKVVKIPKKLYEELQFAISDEEGNIKEERVINVFKIIKVLGDLEEDQLEKLTKRLTVKR